MDDCLLWVLCVVR